MANDELERLLVDPEIQRKVSLLHREWWRNLFGQYDQLVTELKTLEENLRKFGGFLGFGKRIPYTQIKAHRLRINEIRYFLSLLKRTAEALKRYEPFVAREGWIDRYFEVTSYVEPKDVFQSVPLPRKLLQAYDQARRLKLFDRFTIASNKEVFDPNYKGSISQLTLLGCIAYFATLEEAEEYTMKQACSFVLSSWSKEDTELNEGALNKKEHDDSARLLESTGIKFVDE